MINQRAIGKDGAQVDVEPGELRHNLLARLDLPRVPKQARSQEKRDALVQAAMLLFALEGYDRVTTSDIAAEAEVSVGTLYSYFRNKQQLLAYLVAENVDVILRRRLPAIDLAQWPRKALRELLAESVPYSIEEARLRKCWQDLVHQDSSAAAVRAKIQEYVFQELRVAIEGVAEKGLTRADLDVDAMCWAILQLLDKLWEMPVDEEGMDCEAFVRRRNAVADMICFAIFDPERTIAIHADGLHR